MLDNHYLCLRCSREFLLDGEDICPGNPRVTVPCCPYCGHKVDVVLGQVGWYPKGGKEMSENKYKPELNPKRTACPLVSVPGEPVALCHKECELYVVDEISGHEGCSLASIPFLLGKLILLEELKAKH